MTETITVSKQKAVLFDGRVDILFLNVEEFLQFFPSFLDAVYWSDLRKFNVWQEGLSAADCVWNVCGTE